MLRTPRITLGIILKTVALLALTSFIVWYVLFQARSFLTGPVLTLSGTYTLVHSERVIPIEGVAENIVELTLNGRPITTTKEGVFREQLVLEDGYTIVTLEARDRFGRTTAVTQEYVYRPQEGQ